MAFLFLGLRDAHRSLRKSAKADAISRPLFSRYGPGPDLSGKPFIETQNAGPRRSQGGVWAATYDFGNVDNRQDPSLPVFSRYARPAVGRLVRPSFSRYATAGAIGVYRANGLLVGVPVSTVGFAAPAKPSFGPSPGPAPVAQEGASAGALAVTLDNVTLVSEGTISGAGAITGDLAATLDPLTLSSAGQVVINGALASTLGTLTLSSAGQLVIDGDLSATLADLTAGGVGNVEIDADQGSTLGALTLSATGTVKIASALGATLDDVTLVSEGALSGDGEQVSPPTYYGGGRKGRDERDDYQSYSEYFDELNKLRRSIKERKAPAQQRKLVAKVATARQRLVEQGEIDLGPLRASVASLAKSVTVLERARAEASALAELDRLAAQAAMFEEIAVVLLMAA